MFHKAEKQTPLKAAPVVDERLCLACGACVGVCPQNRISLRKSTLVLSSQDCTGCLRCVATCPVGALFLPEIAA